MPGGRFFTSGDTVARHELTSGLLRASFDTAIVGGAIVDMGRVTAVEARLAAKSVYLLRLDTVVGFPGDGAGISAPLNIPQYVESSHLTADAKLCLLNVNLIYSWMSATPTIFWLDVKVNGVVVYNELFGADDEPQRRSKLLETIVLELKLGDVVQLHVRKTYNDPGSMLLRANSLYSIEPLV